VSRSGTSSATDPVERVAELIRQVGRAAQQARRYRALVATVAEPAFDRALAIGTTIRQSLRDPERQQREAAHAAEELEAVRQRCERAIDDVHDSTVYQAALTAVTAGAVNDVTRLAPAIFDQVEPFPDAALLYSPLPIAGGPPGAHFIPPSECAARILAIASEGLIAASPPPELGADERIPAIVLADEHDVAESPLTLVLDAHALPVPVCRLAGSNVALFYAARLHVPFRVRTAAAVSDEWWAIRPDAYREYVDELGAALIASGITVESDG
jgi:hypothetical protein